MTNPRSGLQIRRMILLAVVLLTTLRLIPNGVLCMCRRLIHPECVEGVFCEVGLPLHGVLRSSAHSWYSDVFCAMAHIHSPRAGVCCARCVASAVPREGAGQLSAFLLLEAGTL